LKRREKPKEKKKKLEENGENSGWNPEQSANPMSFEACNWRVGQKWKVYSEWRGEKIYEK
jgi:hypothetical protein